LFSGCDGVAHGEGEGFEAGYRLSGRNVVARCAGEVAQGASGVFLRTSSACLWVCDFASIPLSCCSDVAWGETREVARSPWSLGVRSFYSFWEFVSFQAWLSSLFVVIVVVFVVIDARTVLQKTLRMRVVIFFL
jgi:hypothetical protein